MTKRDTTNLGQNIDSAGSRVLRSLSETASETVEVTDATLSGSVRDPSQTQLWVLIGTSALLAAAVWQDGRKVNWECDQRTEVNPPWWMGGYPSRP